MAQSVKRRKPKSKPAPPRQPEPASDLPAIASKSPRAFSGWPMLVAWAGMLIFALHACTHMVAAGDTWVAMACGRHFVNHGVDTVEPFSANSHKPGPTPEEIKNWPRWAQWIVDKVGLETVKKWHPTGWINQNWLTHVIFYSLVPKSSYQDGLSFTSNALVYWKVSIYIITILCVYYTGVLLGVNPAFSAVFACFALFVGMLVAVFMLILTLATRRNVLYLWLLVPVTVFWANVHGGYVYVFIMMIPFISLHLLTHLSRKWTALLYNLTAWPFLYFVLRKAGLTLPSFLFILLLVVLDIVLTFYKDRLVSIGPKGLIHAIAVCFVAFVAMVLFNPFHLTNLTHTFVISVSKHAARWRDIHEWHPAFEWSNPVGTAVPFLVMYIMAWVVLFGWFGVLWFTARSVRKQTKRKLDRTGYDRPKVDLSLMLIAALTIYMAIRSRRFIPIAAIAACPLLAMLLQQAIEAIVATRNFARTGRLHLSPMPRRLQTSFIMFGCSAVVFFGTWWTLKFKRIYLDPWPADPKFTSIFMRMTASDVKPFYACKFIKDNKLSGKMFNYWTEGGFIAWGQQPDPNTGKTPLQLFMDGRAQAAYDRKMFDVWTYIMAGGEPMQAAVLRGRRPTDQEYIQAGKWISEQLRRHNVWVVLMPAAQFDKEFVRSLETNPDWRIVFLNNKQRLYVDYRTEKGRRLFDGILTGKTIYPDQFCRNLAIAHCLLYYHPSLAAKRQGLEAAIRAFNLHPSPAPMFEIIGMAARYIDLRPRVTQFCQQWFDKFTAEKDKYASQHGYRLRLEAARLACLHLEKVAQLQNDTKKAQTYARYERLFRAERNQIARLKRW